MTDEVHNLTRSQLLALLAGDPKLRQHLAAGKRLRVETPFSYPGRLGPVVVHLGPRPELPGEPAPKAALDDGTAPTPAMTAPPVAEISSAKKGRATPPPPPPPPPGAIRISDGGGLIKCLAEQGMELDIDMILSKTVFHAVQQQEGAGITGSQVYLDSTADAVEDDFWRFLQVVAEVIGLRHVKYKDAIAQFERRKDADEGKLGWRPT